MKTSLWMNTGIAMLSFCVIGCGLVTVKAKSGSGDPSAPRAVILPEKNVAIKSIDGKKAFVTERNWWVLVVTKTRASVLPGEHTLEIAYAVTGWSSLGCRMILDAQPGQTYVLKAKPLPFENTPGVATIKRPQINKVVVWMEDPESGTVLVKETACTPIES